MKFRHLLFSLPVAIVLISCKDDVASADGPAQTISETKPPAAAEAKYHYAIAMTGIT